MSYHSSIKQRIYYSLPYPLKCGFATLYGVQQRRARYGEAFRRTLNALRESQYWTTAQHREAERRTLAEFLPRAVMSARYYRLHADYARCKGPDDLPHLPILEKKSVQESLESFYADDFRKMPHQWGHTSGTTGRALVFPIHRNCFEREYAFRALHYGWGGGDLTARDRFAFCSGHPVAYRDRNQPPFWARDLANNWLLLSSYHLKPDNLAAYIRKLESFQPVVLGGYPSSLYLLALAYQRHGRGKLRLRGVFTASETLLDHQRPVMEEAFGVKVFNWYGNSEMCGHITQCEKGRLHVRHEHSFLEVVHPDGTPCGPGETGHIVATGFHNPAFPLIRYRVGDEVTLSREDACPCGRGGVLVERIEGRKEDYVVTADGRLVGRLDHLFKDSLHIEEAQIVQEEAGKVILRVVRRPDYTHDDEEAVRKQAQLRLGSQTDVRFDYVDALERTAGGKTRFVISHINQQAWIDQLRQAPAAAADRAES